MKGFRFSLWSMFLGVGAVAIVCAALVKPTAAWSMAFQAAAIGALTVALLAALVYERCAARAFWIGFAVVGWGNLGLHRFPMSEVSLTGEISDRLMNVVHPYRYMPPGASPPSTTATGYTATGGFYYVPPNPATDHVESARSAFSHLVVWIWPLLVGFAGGVVAQQLYLHRERLAAKRSPPGSSAS